MFLAFVLTIQWIWANNNCFVSWDDTAYAHGCDHHPQSQPTRLLCIEEVTAQSVSYVLEAAWEADKFMEHLHGTRSKSWSCVVGWYLCRQQARAVQIQGWFGLGSLSILETRTNDSILYEKDGNDIQSLLIRIITCISSGECSIVSDVYACFGYQADWAMIQASDECWLVWMLIAHSCCVADHTEEPRANGNKSNVLIAERWMF